MIVNEIKKVPRRKPMKYEVKKEHELKLLQYVKEKEKQEFEKWVEK